MMKKRIGAQGKEFELAQLSSEKDANPAPGTTSKLTHGKWVSSENFQYHSPANERAWIVDAYRQGVHHANWLYGNPADERTEAVVHAGLAGGVSGFRGPDGQFRLGNFKTTEDPDVLKIKAASLRGKTASEIQGASLPGEQEALQYVLGKKEGNNRSASLPSNRQGSKYLVEGSRAKEEQTSIGQIAATILPPIDNLLPPANDNYCPMDPEQDEACKEMYEGLRQVRADILSGRADDTSDAVKADYNRAANLYNESCVPFGHPELPLF